MTDTTNQTGSIIILALVTIVLSVYTLVSLRWWNKHGDRLTKRWVGPRWSGLLLYILGLVAIALTIVAPMFLLFLLIGELKLGKSLGVYGIDTVLFVWIFPGAIYNLVMAFRQSGRK
jgi:hypothetical protein